MILDSPHEIQKAISDFTEGLPEMDKQRYNRVYTLLKDLSLDSDGKIKNNLSNLKIIDRVKNELGRFIDSPIYQDKIEALNKAIERVSILQASYYAKTFSDFTHPKTIEKIKQLTYSNVIDGLAGSGIRQEVVNVSAELVENGIRNGASFSTMVDELKVQLVGNKEVDSRLISYSKQIINDTMSSFARNYHAIVTNDLGLEWFMYVGALVSTSRPICISLVKKLYIHKSEIASIARGEVDGVKVSKAGMMPDTTGENFIYRCGGFNCDHQMIPVPASVVPKEIRKEYEKE